MFLVIGDRYSVNSLNSVDLFYGLQFSVIQFKVQFHC